MSLNVWDRNRAIVKLGLSSSGAHRVMRLFYAAKTSRSGGEQEMRHREVRIVLDRPPEPTDRLLIAPRAQLRETHYLKPTARAPVAWT